MRKADDHDLRDALSEEVELLVPSDELWNKIYKRSVVQQEKKRRPWLTSALTMGAAAAVAAVFLLNGPMKPSTVTGPEPPTGNSPSLLAAQGDNTRSITPAVSGNSIRPMSVDPNADRLSVRYSKTTYWYNGESIPPESVGDLLTLTTRESGDPNAPQPNGYSANLPAGKEIRTIKGADPAHRIAVQTDQGWLIFDDQQKSLPTP